MYSVEDLDSFEKLKTWYVELRKYLGDETPIIIAGNKCDLPTYTVPREAGEAYAAEQNVEHKWTSAKTGKGVDDVFRTLTQSKQLVTYVQLLNPCFVTEIVEHQKATGTGGGRRKKKDDRLDRKADGL